MTERDPRFLARSDISGSALLHLRFEGRSREIALDVLDVGVASSDTAVRNAVAAFLDVPAGKLSAYVVERHENGNLTLRPEAVFG
ncbi:MAG: hypothetical protein SGJ27_15640 [Candidatus Melainabacteria bacterium]|nr:hypothetical protein [Candidatus Melainabacteria bacterium]